MKRLVEQVDDADPNVRAGATLLSKVAPFELSVEQRRRIFARLEAEPEASRVRFWRPAFALPVLLLVGVASATVGPHWYRSRTAPQALPAPARHDTPKAKATALPTPAPAAPEPTEPAATAEPAPEVEADAVPLGTPAPRASQSGPGASLMMEALRARRAGDTARAQQLTAEYQKKYPNGALREEALAIAFESAAAARNEEAARKQAQKYLASFPQGRFRQQAEQVLSRAR